LDLLCLDTAKPHIGAVRMKEYERIRMHMTEIIIRLGKINDILNKLGEL